MELSHLFLICSCISSTCPDLMGREGGKRTLQNNWYISQPSAVLLTCTDVWLDSYRSLTGLSWCCWVSLLETIWLFGMIVSMALCRGETVVGISAQLKWGIEQKIYWSSVLKFCTLDRQETSSERGITCGENLFNNTSPKYREAAWLFFSTAISSFY